MEATPAKHYNWVTFSALLLLLVGLLFANAAMVAPYLLAVVMGGILAMVFRPLYAYLCGWKLGPKTASLTATLAVALLVIIPVCGFVIVAVSQGIEVARSLPEPSQFSIEKLTARIAQWKPLAWVPGNVANLESELRKLATRIGSAAPNAMFKFFGGLPELVLQTMLGLLSLYFFLLDGNRFLVWLRDKVPLDPTVRGALVTSFRDTAVSTLLATLAAASVQTVIMFVAFLVLGVPAAFLAGGLTFVMAWVPLVGSSPIWIGGAGYLLASGSPGKAVVMIGFGMLTGLSDNVVHPMVLKGKSEMHPLVSLVAIFGGIQLFGLFGVFIGPILAALLISVLEVWPIVAERFGLLRSTALVTGSAFSSLDKAVPGLHRDEISSNS